MADTSRTITVTAAASSAGVIEIAELKTETFTNPTATLAGATTSSSYFRVIKAQTNPKGRPWAYPYIVCTNTSRHAVEILENYSRVFDVMAKWGSATDTLTDRCAFMFYQCGPSYFAGCIAKDCLNTDGTKVAHGFWVYQSDGIIVNCLAHNVESAGFISTTSSMKCYNCTSTDNGAYGYYDAGLSTTICKNCVATGNATANFQSIDSNLNSATSNVNYKDSTNDDCHIILPSTGANNVGASLASDASYSFDDDIDFQTRPYGVSPWDVGWDEISALSDAGGLAFGEQYPNQGEDPESWQTWNDENTNVPPIIIGDQDWGILGIPYNKEGRSLVYFFAGTFTKKITINTDRYQAGSVTGTIQIRGQNTVFYQDDASPSWTTYSGVTYQTWQYIHVRITKT